MSEKKLHKLCSECKERLWCVFPCLELDAELARIDEELEGEGL